MSVTIDNAQLTEALKALKTLPDALKKDTLIKIFRTTARPIVQRAKAGAPKSTGVLARSIGTKVGRSKTNPKLIVGPMANRGGYHGHLLEEGTAERFKKSGAKTGQVKPYEYMKSAWNSEKDAASQKIANQVIRLIDRQLKKHGFR